MKSRLQEDQGPDPEAEHFPDKEHQQGPEGVGPVESQPQGDDIPDDGHPADEGHPDAVFIDIPLLLFQFFTAHLEGLFQPLPFAETAQEIGGHAAEPVAQRSDQQAGHRLFGDQQHGDVERVRTERDHRGRQKGAQKQAQESPAAEIHLSEELLDTLQGHGHLDGCSVIVEPENLVRDESKIPGPRFAECKPLGRAHRDGVVAEPDGRRGFNLISTGCGVTVRRSGEGPFSLKLIFL